MGGGDDDFNTNNGDLEVANNIPVAEVNNEEYEYGEYDEEEEEAPEPVKPQAAKVQQRESTKPTAKVEVPSS